jgi:hypothetical protein
MPTTKQRISISPDARVLSALQVLSKRRRKALASVSLDLIERALELEEDLHFSRIADERLEQDEKRVPHERAWR